jgi:polar amino acid transport system substrate-binding protein
MITRRTVLLTALDLASAAGTVTAVTAASWATEAPPLRLCYFEAYAPFAFRDAAGAMTGIQVDALDLLLAQRMGLRVSHEGYPWARAQEIVRTGLGDGFCTSPTAERQAYALFSPHPVFRAPSAVVYLRDGPAAPALAAAQTIGDLRGLQHVNYIGNQFIARLFGADTVAWVPTPALALEMIARGHADFMVWAGIATRYEVHRLGFDAILADHPIDVGEVAAYHLGLRRSLPGVEALMAGFSAALAAAEADGAIAAILARDR